MEKQQFQTVPGELVRNAGYDQPSDPPAYSQPTHAVATPHPHYAYGPPTVVTQPPANYTTTNMVITQGAAVAPSNYINTTTTTLVLSILSCLCCCWPLGIIAIIFAAIACSSAGAGNDGDARRYEAIARGLNIAGLVLGILCYIFVIVYYAALRQKLEDEDENGY